MFCVMLTIAVGNTGLQSVLPAVGRSMRIPDLFIGLAFSFSALIWSMMAPFWARRLERHGARRMIVTGLGGFILSLLSCGTALTAGVRDWLPVGIAFAVFVFGRGIYGTLGAAAPPAVQAFLVARSAAAERTRILTLLASAFGLGTILGPALAPFFVLPFFGLAGPLYVFALLGVGILAAAVKYLDDAPVAQGAIAPAQEPSIGAEPDDAVPQSASPQNSARGIGYFENRVKPWMIAGLVSGHAQAIAGQTMAFLLIDRLALTPAAAQPIIGLVLMSGAGAALLAQWGVIPRLNLNPRQLCIWGSLLAAGGCFGVAFAPGLHGTTVAFAVASLGFGFLRPGFAAGASLAVSQAEQAAVAGRVTAINGLCFVVGPGSGILLYDIWHPLPYLVSMAALLALALYGRGRLHLAGPAVQPAG